ncbi:hypothetical protein F5Y03DRAFT_342478 [Xylaria venustula]|nr:hypothetical protein F5Y03DRAFT_342478 [Xylaria venustula]
MHHWLFLAIWGPGTCFIKGVDSVMGGAFRISHFIDTKTEARRTFLFYTSDRLRRLSHRDKLHYRKREGIGFTACTRKRA